jgi:homocitrate synthase NifV
MIRIIDRTLSLIDGFSLGAETLRELTRLILTLAPDGIELSERSYCVAGAETNANVTVRLNSADDCERYPEVKSFVAPPYSGAPGREVRAELHVNDAHETRTLMSARQYASVRLTGFGDILASDSANPVARISAPDDTQLCPADSLGLATATAVEWCLLPGRRSVVTSVFGVGGFAATEEVTMALRGIKRRHVGRTFAELPALRDMLEDITGEITRGGKPVVGRDIFAVKSGVHVDGILKAPRCYTPYPPGDVGQTNTILVGRQSGLAAVRYMLSVTGITLAPGLESELLARVKALGDEKNDNLTSDEFASLARTVAGGGI